MRAWIALFALAAGACSHAGSARAVTIECAPTAGSRTIDGLDAAQACALVRERAQAGLVGRAGVAPLRIELDLSRPGSAIARIPGHDEIAVDVTDRPLRRDDLLRLADAIVQILLAGPPSRS